MGTYIFCICTSIQYTVDANPLNLEGLMAKRHGKPVAIFLLICYVVNVHTSTNIYCPWAVNTVKTVASCPITKEERDKASDLKNCKQFAQKQNCSDPSKFQYHCVMNELQNKLLEVCAPTRYILGYCPEFNVKGGIIQDHYSLDCSKFEPPCKTRYISTDAYLYHACYDQIKMSPVSDVISSTYPSVIEVPILSTSNNTTLDASKKETPSTDVIIGVTISAILMLFLAAATFIACYFKRHSKRIPCWRKESTREAGNDESNQERLAMLKELETEITGGEELKGAYSIFKLQQR
ncbi:uncharacterized protein LOC134256312 [Saccostrea cucullata]|uniref:uncharacterized protein LOC134256312 n=1 Tax=Saccostrea cuccullata TaxID=36930 RepID=UPI002ED2AE86